jgi:hypothetical protein
MVFVICSTVEIIVLLFGGMLPEFIDDVSLGVLIAIDFLLILMLVVTINFFFLIPNRSRKLAKAERVES